METRSVKRHSVNHSTDKLERNKLSFPPLFKWQFCPPWLQYNKFILDGYRCRLSTTECLESLFYVHNETVNVYSHGKYWHLSYVVAAYNESFQTKQPVVVKLSAVNTSQ